MKTGIMINRIGDVALENCHAKATICIWLVDDNAFYREHLTIMLNAEPRVNCSRNFSCVSSLLAALRQESLPDAILEDVEMPVMGGIEAIQPIKNLAPSIKVLMITTFQDPCCKKQALMMGASDYLLKRNSPDQIIAAIRTALEH
jgi:DNA-binding NarL/FixJ family response regulator